MGRVHVIGPAAVNAVCDLIAEGQSLVSACKSLGYRYSTVSHTLTGENTPPEYEQKYQKAKESRADWLADEIVALADEPLPALADGRIDGGLVAQRRLQLDARKWVAAKLRPRTYGDKLDVQHQGNVTLMVDTGVPLRTVTALPQEGVTGSVPTIEHAPESQMPNDSSGNSADGGLAEDSTRGLT